MAPEVARQQWRSLRRLQNRGTSAGHCEVLRRPREGDSLGRIGSPSGTIASCIQEHVDALASALFAAAATTTSSARCVPSVSLTGNQTRSTLPQMFEKTGAPRRNRTADPIITNDVLYQLSYRGTARVLGERP